MWVKGKKIQIKGIFKLFSPRVSVPLRVALQFLSKTMPLHCSDLKSKTGTNFFLIIRKSKINCPNMSQAFCIFYQA